MCKRCWCTHKLYINVRKHHFVIASAPFTHVWTPEKKCSILYYLGIFQDSIEFCYKIKEHWFTLFIPWSQRSWWNLCCLSPLNSREHLFSSSVLNIHRVWIICKTRLSCIIQINIVYYTGKHGVLYR